MDRLRARVAPWHTVDDFFIGAEPPQLLLCATCGRLLGDDPEDEPDGDAGLPICGECDRARDFDVLLETHALRDRAHDDDH
jgi:hypothetical protein